MEAGRQQVRGQPKLHGLYPKGKKSLKVILKIKLILVFPKINKNGNKILLSLISLKHKKSTLITALRKYWYKENTDCSIL